jgi:hypothetical protein
MTPDMYPPVTPEEAARNRKILEDALREHDEAARRAGVPQRQRARRPAARSGWNATPEELRREIAAVLPPRTRHLTEALASVAEEFALALLGARHPSCGKWMPKAHARCGFGSGHAGECRSVWSERRHVAREKRRRAAAKGRPEETRAVPEPRAA